MKPLMRTIIVLAAATSFSACSITPTPSFRTDVAPDAPLASYRTYAWAFDGAPSGIASPLTFQRVREQFDSNLRANGFVPANAEEADMIVAFTLGSRDSIDVTDWGPVAPYYPGYGRAYRYGWAYNYRDVDVRTVTEGSMAFDVFDGETNRPVWHGLATERISDSGASDALIEAATSGMIRRFMEDRNGAGGN